MNPKHCALVVALPFLAACAGGSGEMSKDRYGLAKQPQVYFIHQVTTKPFAMEVGGQLMTGSALSVIGQKFEAARLQEEAGLRDPAAHGKDRLAEALRRELGLTNVQVLAEDTQLPLLPQDLSDEARAAGAPTFQQQHRTGLLVQVFTYHWGMKDYQIKYAAIARLVSLDESKIVMAANCPWVLMDQPESRNVSPPSAYDERGNFNPNALMEQRDKVFGVLFANKGAVVNANLRKAAEICSDRLVARFLGSGPAAKP